MTTVGPIRVLVVDDDEDAAAMTAERLAADHGLETVAETSIEGALTAVADDVDCVVSNAGMAGMAGTEFRDAVRDRYRSLPFVFLVSREGGNEVPGEAIASGRVEYLFRFELVEDGRYDRLASRIERLVTRDRTRAAHERLVSDHPDPIAQVAGDGTVLSANPQMATLLEATRDELVGSTLAEVFPDEVAKRRLELGREAIEAGEPRSNEGLHGDRHVRTTAVPIRTAGPESFYLIARDITERKRCEHALDRQTERLENFASVVSHDLRNPLNVAQSSVELFRADGIDNDHVDRLDRSLTRMGDIIEDALTLVRECDVVDDPPRVDLGAITREAWSFVDSDGVSLELEGEKRLPADADRLAELLENLFRNAVEHGETTDRITVGPLEDGFYVEDDGTGIPEDERDDVFSVGYSTARAGTGLGLNIVDQIASNHGWEVSLTDSEAGGTRVEITGVDD